MELAISGSSEVTNNLSNRALIPPPPSLSSSPLPQASELGLGGYPDSTNIIHMLNQSGFHDIIRVVPSKWLSDQPLDRNLGLLLSAIFLALCLINNVCCVLIFIVFSRKRHLRTASNRLLLSLTVADFLLLSTCYFIVIQGFLGRPLLGTLGCQLYGFLGTLAALAEIWSLTAIGIDRMKAIFHPLEKHKRLRRKHVHCILTILWSASFLLALAPLLGWNRYVAEAYLVGCSFDAFSTSWSDRSYIILLVIVAWLLPMILIGMSYIKIFTSVKAGLKFWTEMQSSAEEQRRRVEQNLAKMVLCLVLLWVISWTPYALLATWTMFTGGAGLSQTLAVIPTVMCKLSGTFNSFVYGIRLPKFQREIILLFRSRRAKQGGTSGVGEITCSPPRGRLQAKQKLHVAKSLPEKMELRQMVLPRSPQDRMLQTDVSVDSSLSRQPLIGASGHRLYFHIINPDRIDHMSVDIVRSGSSDV